MWLLKPDCLGSEAGSAPSWAVLGMRIIIPASEGRGENETDSYVLSIWH